MTGSSTTLYRGPYGEYNDVVFQAAKDTNHKMIQWSIDSLDWQGLTGEQMWERINSKLDNGAIILMHSGTENTALSLDMILTKIEEKGFKVVKVSDLIYTQGIINLGPINKENDTVDANGVQHKNV